MFEGKRFLPETGTPMRKMDRMRTLFAVCEPDPLAVATCSEKSLATTSEDAPAREEVSVRSLDMLVFPPGPRPSLAPAGRGKMRRDLNSARARMEESQRANRLAVSPRDGIPPRDALAGVRRVGGTKNPALAAIRDLKPDLVFCNSEENRKEDVEELKRELAVDVSHPRTVAEIPALLRHFGRLTGTRERAEEISLKVKEALDRVEHEAEFRFVYLIWKDLWMTVGPRTYIADLLRHVGGLNAFEEKYA